MRIAGGEQWLADADANVSVAAAAYPVPDCPICGASHQTCTRDVRIEMAKSASETSAKTADDSKTEQTSQASTNAAPTDGKVIKAEAPRAAEPRMDEPEADEPMVVKENVYQEFYPANTRRPSYRLLFHKGQTVLKSEYEAATKG